MAEGLDLMPRTGEGEEKEEGRGEDPDEDYLRVALFTRGIGRDSHA